jgi:Holliday junction resolvase RusA-like endonuclease
MTDRISIDEYRALTEQRRLPTIPRPLTTLPEKPRKLSEPKRFTQPVNAVRLELPLPPSVNSAWTNVVGVGRVRSTGYRRWHKQAMDELMLQKPGRVSGKFCIVVKLGRIKRRADCDNRLKGILDLLSNVVTDDDAMCERASIGWADDVPAERVVVEVRAA